MMCRMTLRLATAMVLGLLALAQAGPVVTAQGSAACSPSPCRAYLPLLASRARLTVAEPGSVSGPWQHLAAYDRALDLAHDREGNLWAATLGGLVEWPADGGEPRVHSHDPISEVAVDATGSVWFGGAQTALGLDPSGEADPLQRRLPDGRVQRFTAADGLPRGWLRELAVDAAGRVYGVWGPLGEAMPGGLARWEEGAGWRGWPADPAVAALTPWAICPDGAGGLWLAGGRLRGAAVIDAWLRRVDAGGRTLAAEALPPPFGEFGATRLVLGPGGRLYAILVAFPPVGPSAEDPALNRYLLAVRSAAGDWTQLDLPLAEVSAARMNEAPRLSGPHDLVVDDAGNLWLLFNGALLSMGRDGSQDLYPNALPDRPSSPAAQALGDLLLAHPVMAALPAGGVVLGARAVRGIATIRPGDRTAAWVGVPGALPGRVWSLSEGPGGLVAVGDDDGLRRLWFRAVSENGWQGIDGRRRSGPQTLRRLVIGADGHHWIADGDQVIHAGPDRSRIETLRPGEGLPGGLVNAIVPRPQGDLWVGTEQGLVHRDADGAWSTVALPTTLSPNVAELAVGAGGGMWVALGMGLRQGSPGMGGVVHVDAAGRSRHWSTAELAGFEPDSAMRVGQSHVVWTPGGSVFTTSIFGLIHGRIEGPWRQGPTDFARGTVMRVDGAGQVWGHYESRRLGRLDPESGVIEPFDLPPMASGTFQVQDLALDPRSDDLWLLGTTRAILRFDGAGHWERYNTQPFLQGQPTIDDLWALALSPAGDLVLGGADRLLVDGPGGTGTWEPQDRLSEGAEVAAAGCSDLEGRYWLQHRRGLSAYRPGEGWRHLRSADGLPPLDRERRPRCAPDGAIWLLQDQAGVRSDRVERWHPATGLTPMSAVMGLRPGEAVREMAWSTTGRWAALIDLAGAAGGPGAAVLIEQAPGTTLRPDHQPLADAAPTDLLWSPDGRRLWIATDRGLASLDPREPAAAPVWVADPAVAGRSIRDLAWQGGRLWAVGEGGAAERLADGGWRLYTEDDGLYSEDLVQAGEGLEGELWLLNEGGSVDRLRP